MALARPAFNNFSSGAITPKLYGQMDSQLYKTGLAAMKNFVPELFGSAKRRGGLKKIAALPVEIVSKCRIIPWSVNKDIDILILLSDKRIDLFDVSYGHTAGFIAQTGTLPVTKLKDGYDAYLTAELYDINYATGMGTMYLAHNNHPLFKLQFLGYDADADGSPPAPYFTFETGTVKMAGGIAYTPEISDLGQAAGDPMTATMFISGCSRLTANTPVTVDAGIIDGVAVDTIEKVVVTPARHCSAYAATWAGTVVANNTNIVDSGSGWPGLDVHRPYFYLAESASSADIIAKKNGITITQMMNAFEAAGIKDDQWYSISYYANKWDLFHSTANGTLKYFRAVPKVTYKVTFDDIGPTTKIIDENTAIMAGYIDIDALGIHINKNVVGGAAALDNVTPWMTTGTAYQCDNKVKFCGIYPDTAVKNDGEKTYDENDDLIGETDASITVTGYVLAARTGFPEVIHVTRDYMATGQLGVIINPFIGQFRDPAFVAFHNGRMVVGGSKAEPNVLYLSKTNDHTNFCYFDEIEYEKNTVKPKAEWTNPDLPEYDVEVAIVQQIGQDSAMRLQFLTDESEALKWAASIGDLIIGTATSEWVIPADITAHNPRAIMTSRNGSCAVQGRFVKGSILFASGNANSFKMFQGKQGEVTDAISDHAEHLFRANGRIESFDFRQDPYFGIVSQMSSGKAILGVINSDSLGWCEVSTTGTDTIESICTIAVYEEDAVYAIALRGALRYLERMMTTDDNTSLYTDRVYLDSWETVATSGAGAIAGLARFYNKTKVRVVFSNGAYGAPVIAVAGTTSTYVDPDGVTKTNPLSTAGVIGYQYESEMTTLRIDSSQIEGLNKLPASFHLRVYRSGDFSIKRQRALDTEVVKVYVPNDEAGARIYPYTGPLRTENPNGAGEDQSLTIFTESHEPLTVQVIVPSYGVGEEP